MKSRARRSSSVTRPRLAVVVPSPLSRARRSSRAFKLTCATSLSTAAKDPAFVAATYNAVAYRPLVPNCCKGACVVPPASQSQSPRPIPPPPPPPPPRGRPVSRQWDTPPPRPRLAVPSLALVHRVLEFPTHLHVPPARPLRARRRVRSLRSVVVRQSSRVPIESSRASSRVAVARRRAIRVASHRANFVSRVRAPRASIARSRIARVVEASRRPRVRVARARVDGAARKSHARAAPSS